MAVILGYSNASRAVYAHVDGDDKCFTMLNIADSQNGNVPRGRREQETSGFLLNPIVCILEYLNGRRDSGVFLQYSEPSIVYMYCRKGSCSGRRCESKNSKLIRRNYYERSNKYS